MADLVQVNSAVKEALILARAYRASTHSVVFEKLIGDSYGYAAIATTYSVVRETIIKLASIQVQSVVKEALLYKPSDDLTQARMVGSLRHAAIMKRPPTPPPSTVRGDILVASYHERVLKAQARTWTHSYTRVAAMIRLCLCARSTQRAPDVWSQIGTGSYAQLVVQSRVNAYVPVSLIRVSSQRQLAVVKRDVPARQVSHITAIQNYELVVQSRVKGSEVIRTDAFVFTQAQQVVQAAPRATPINDIVGKLFEQVLVRRPEGETPVNDIVGALTEQVLIGRTLVPQKSEAIAGQVVEQVLMQRRMFPPEFSTGRHVKSYREQVVMARAVPPFPERSISSVGNLRLSFILYRTTPRPIDVIDPAIGRHVAAYAELAVQHRSTTPPDQIYKLMRTVTSLAEQVVHADAFPLPPYPEPELKGAMVQSLAEQVVHADAGDWSAVSALTAALVTEALMVGDNAGWIDPVVPRSDAQVAQVVEPVVHGDAFLPPDQLISDTSVVVLVEQVATSDTFIPAGVPQSVAQVNLVARQAVIADAAWPNPSVPTSELRVIALIEQVATSDTFVDAAIPASAAQVNMLGAQIVLTDPAMMGIPKRTGPRPVVSSSIS